MGERLRSRLGYRVVGRILDRENIAHGAERAMRAVCACGASAAWRAAQRACKMPQVSCLIAGVVPVKSPKRTALELRTGPVWRELGAVPPHDETMTSHSGSNPAGQRGGVCFDGINA
jgi:hypothetical protein